MIPLSFCPVDPIAIKGAFCSLYLHMSLDRSHPVKFERAIFASKLPLSLFWMPIGFCSPFGRLIGMASLAPLPEHLEQIRIHLRKTALRTDAGVVVRPPSNVCIEVFDQDRLWECHVGPDLFLESLLMPFHGRLAWGDKRLEAESSSITSFS